MSYDPNELMLELFRAEVESHSDSLTESLLKLEQDPTATSLLEGLMRAAHSIKGAARLVRVDPAAEVAHVMEDCFVAAQRGELVLEPAGIDVLLRCVDLLSQVSEASKDPNVDWSDFIPVVHSSVGQLRSVLNRQPLPVEALDASSSTTVEPRTLEPKAIEPKAIEAKTVEAKAVEPKTLAAREEEFFQATALATGQSHFHTDVLKRSQRGLDSTRNTRETTIQPAARRGDSRFVANPRSRCGWSCALAFCDPIRDKHKPYHCV